MTGPGADRARAAPLEDDPGQTRERTALAWMRSALSMLVSAGLIVRAGVSAHETPLGLAGGAVLVALAVLTWRHGETTGRHPELRASTQGRAFRLLSAATLFIAALSLIVAVAF